MFPRLRSKAPDFSGMAVVNQEFKYINSSDYTGKYVVLFFYQLDFLRIGKSEILEFSKRAEEFRKIGCEVIACSTDSQYCHLAWTKILIEKRGIGAVNIPLLSDLSRRIGHTYGVLDQDLGASNDSFFVIDRLQNLRHIYHNDPHIGISVDEALRVVQAVKHSDENDGECSADWKPDDKTLNPDPEKLETKI